MSDPKPPAITADHWPQLRAFTPARLALGRAGSSLPTTQVLAFQLAHAQARDAVWTPLDGAALAVQLAADGWQTRAVHSAAVDRHSYLARPDWGRRLADESRDALAAARSELNTRPDVVFVLSDGLSSTAVQQHAAALLQALRPPLEGLQLAPVVIATQARVAMADEVGEILQAALAVNLIGERPGLSSPDSLGAYVTYAPRVGLTDAARYCVSNIRPQGLAIAEAAAQLAALIREVLQTRHSGLHSPIPQPALQGN